jgi:hypothetical protein
MAKCWSCDSVIKGDAAYCQSCGTGLSPARSIVTAVPTTSVGVSAATLTPEAMFHVRSAVSGVVSGPYSDAVLQQYIQHGAVGIADMLWDPREGQWITIARSRFAPVASAAASYVRVATSTCPQCGTPLIALMQRSKLGLVLIIIGILLTPVFFIGVPIWIVGFAIRFGGKGKLVQRCPRCQYTA